MAESSRRFWRRSIDHGRQTTPELSRWCTVTCAEGTTGKRAAAGRSGGCRTADLPKWWPTFGALLFSAGALLSIYFPSQTPFLPTPTEKIPLSFSEMSSGVVTRQKGIRSGSCNSSECPAGTEVVGPGGVPLRDPPPILPIRKSDDLRISKSL